MVAMRRFSAVCIAASALVTFAAMSPARALDPGSAEFAAGDFFAARAAGREAGTGAGFALACQAGMVIGSYLETGEAAVSSLHGAIGDCARAIEMDSRRVDAFVNYAIAVAFEAKRLNSRQFAAAARCLMEDAVARFPQSGFAHAALAGWHGSVSDQGFFARTVLGGSRDDAEREFDEALRLEPGNFAVNYQHLRFLAAGGKKDRANAATIAAHLVREVSPKDKFEELLRERAGVIEAALAKGELSASEALKATEPFYMIDKARSDGPFEPPYLTRFPDPQPSE